MVRDNSVFQLAMQFAGEFSSDAPESAVFGYTRLSRMDDKQIENLLSGEDLSLIDPLRGYFTAKHLDPELLVTGCPMLLNKKGKKYFESPVFAAYLNSDGPSKPVDVLEKALQCAKIDFLTIFKEGNEISDVLEAVLSDEDNGPSEDAPKTKKAAKKTAKKAADSKVPKKDSEEVPEKNEKPAGPESAENEIREFLFFSEKYEKFANSLLDVVKGQDEAVYKFVQGIFQGDIFVKNVKKDRPKSYFFFFGPPGVGKTLLAETAAEALGIPYKIFNMSEYSDHQAHDTLIGVGALFNGGGKDNDGTLTKFIRENPESLLLFDEIEKAHINTIRLFLQMLSAGKIQDVYKNKMLSLDKTIIIFTSNVGKELYEDRSVNLTALPEKVIVDAIRSDKNEFGAPAFPPELCSRIAAGNTILFNHLSTRHLAGMVRKNFDEVCRGMEEEFSIKVTYSPKLPILFLYHFGDGMDARVATGQSANFLKNELFELVRQLKERPKGFKKITDICFDIDESGMESELSRLFENREKSEILLLSGEEEKQYFDLDKKKYTVYHAKDPEKAKEYLKKDIMAAFIDPFFGKKKKNGRTISIADYDTDGVRFFHELLESESGIPAYILMPEGSFTETDKRTFLQEGASGHVETNPDKKEEVRDKIGFLLDELYMEKESVAFSQRGYMIDFKTRQDVESKTGRVDVVFYDLKKRMSVDVESRGQILSDVMRPEEHFDDVIGAKDAKEELKYYTNFLKNPKQFLSDGGKPPKGLLLYGPPGTGKTMLARAMAGESDVMFIQTSASEFKNRYVGESEANIRRLFQRARKYAPAIIFIDEIDAIGKQRTGHDSIAESMLNALLTEMDGFVSDSRKPVFVLAATNYGVGSGSEGIASLDEALLRRFDNKVYVDLPTKDERKEYISRQAKKKKMTGLSENVCNNIADRTMGQSLAVLQNVMDRAFRNAVREKRKVEDKDLLNALEEYLYGEKKESSEEYYRNVAIHETGHAYISYLGNDAPSYITIEARGHFGGYMQHSDKEDTPTYSKEDLLSRIRTCLAGRAAEQVFYGKEKAINTGASSDLRHATSYAFQILSTYGMEDGRLAVLSRDEVLKSPLADEYLKRINEILDQEMEKTLKLIEDGKETIQRIADALVEKSHLTGEEFLSLIRES